MENDKLLDPLMTLLEACNWYGYGKPCLENKCVFSNSNKYIHMKLDSFIRFGNMCLPEEGILQRR